MWALQLKSFKESDKGSVAIIFALALPLFIGAIALAVEVGNWRSQRSHLQVAADMAALAGAHEHQLTDQNSSIKLAAKGEAYENGFNLSGGDIKVFSPPQSGPYAGQPGIEVILTQQEERYFTKFFAKGDVEIQASATALLIEGDPACILTLNNTAAGSISFSGSSSVTLENCAVQANSNSSEAVDLGGSSSLEADCVYTAGGIEGESHANLNCPKAVQNHARTRDPYSDFSVPDNVSSMSCEKEKKKGKHDIELSAGRYCKDVTGNGLVDLVDGGTYYFDGVDLELKSSHAELFGREITLVFMNGGTLRNANGGIIDITADLDGPFAGMAIFFDPDSSADVEEIKINGNQDSKIEGVIYAPDQHITFTGGANNNSDCTLVVADTVSFSGNAGFSNTGCEARGIDTPSVASGVALYH